MNPDIDMNVYVAYRSDPDVQPWINYDPEPGAVIESCSDCKGWFAEVHLDSDAPAGYSVTEWHGPTCYVWTLDEEDAT